MSNISRRFGTDGDWAMGKGPDPRRTADDDAIAKLGKRIRELEAEVKRLQGLLAEARKALPSVTESIPKAVTGNAARQARFKAKRRLAARGEEFGGGES